MPKPAKPTYLWTCKSCGWINGVLLSKHGRKCTNCQTNRGDTSGRNVSFFAKPAKFDKHDGDGTRTNARTSDDGTAYGSGGAVAFASDSHILNNPWGAG